MSLRISYLLQTFLPTFSLQQAPTSPAAQTADLLVSTEPALGLKRQGLEQPRSTDV